jgi:hypothetical protein
MVKSSDALIFFRCEKSREEANHSYSNAMKMRASLTYGFSQLRSRGTSTWTVDEDGKATGNPSISHVVSTYMTALKRRKVCDSGKPVV